MSRSTSDSRLSPRGLLRDATFVVFGILSAGVTGISMLVQHNINDAAGGMLKKRPLH